MKKERRTTTLVAWISLAMSVVSILLWLCRYEPVTWTLFDTALSFLSLVIAVLAIMLGYNIFGLRNEIKREIRKDLQDVSDRHEVHSANTMIYLEARILKMAMLRSDIIDVKQSIIMMLDAANKIKSGKDVDYTVSQMEVIAEQYGDEFLDDMFKIKLRSRLVVSSSFSDNASLFQIRFLT